MDVGLRISAVAVLTTVSLLTFQAYSQEKLPVGDDPETKTLPVNLPQWPYPPDPPPGRPKPQDDDQPHHLPGSTRVFSMKEIEGSGAVDWFPASHPAAPASVVDGKAGVYRACGSCHLIDGRGKPDEQSLNGLPVTYMQQQLEDMKNGLRQSSVKQGGTINMILVADAVPEADAKEALEYFHSVGPVKWIRVVETEEVPKTTLGRHSLEIPDPSGTKEPIGNRILEVPENYERTLLRDPTSGFVAYVPRGSLTKGEVLVKTGAHGRTVTCATCHGTDLRGIGDTVPPIAGRSPTTTGRQLYDFKTGARHGKYSAAMTPVVEKLTDEDIVDISAYLASLSQ